MTNLDEGLAGTPSRLRCAWCGRPVPEGGGPGRPRRFCRRSCRQRDFEARRRSREHGLTEAELIVTRQALSRLDDLLYGLACAVEDVHRDLAGGHDTDDVRRALDWLLEAAEPLVAMSAGLADHLGAGRGASP